MNTASTSNTSSTGPSPQRKKPSTSGNKERSLPTRKDDSGKTGPLNLKSELALKFKNYDPAWFKKIAETTPEEAFFGANHNIVYTVQNFVRHIDLDAEFPEVRTIQLGGPIEAACPSPDYSCFCVSFEEQGDPKLVVFSGASCEERFVVGLKHVANTLAISQAAEVVVCLSVVDERVLLNTFDLTDGVALCTGELMSENLSKSWQLSICPADEGVVCALGGSTAFLLRCTNGYIENFSSINLTDVTCHGWSNDVTMAFGTADGKLRLYRETIALEVIDIIECCQSLKECPSTKILQINVSLCSFGVFIENGVIVAFPVDSNGPKWNEAKSIVLQLSSIDCCKIVLSYDCTDEFILYSTGTQLKYASIKYSVEISEDAGILLATTHSAPVILVQSNHCWIASLDENSLLNVASLNTGRSILQEQLKNVIYFLLVESNVIVVTSQSIDRYLITIGGLFLLESMFRVSPKKCCDSVDSQFLAIAESSRIIVFSVADWKILLDEALLIKKEIKKIVFSTDAKFLVLLTKNDNILCMDVSNGKTIWTLDYKLQFFTDIVFTNQTVYLLDQTLVVNRIKHGKVLSTVNVHAPEVGYSCSSLHLAANSDNVFVSTDNGAVIKCSFKQLDNPKMIKPMTKKNVSFMRYANNALFVGYIDGTVSMIDDRRLEKAIDWISCDFSTVVNLSHCIRNLDYERNLIRKDTNDLVTQYKEARDIEIREMQSEYNSSMKTMRERIKRFEDNFEESEASKAKTIANLQHLYSQEVKWQQEKFEKSLNEQVKKNLQLEEDNKNMMKEKDIELEHAKQDLVVVFRETESKIREEKNALEENVSKLKMEVGGMKKLVLFTERCQEKEAMINREALESVKEKRKTEVAMLEQEIWNLKTVAAQLKAHDENTSEALQVEKNAHTTTKNKLEQAIDETKHLNTVIQQLKSRLATNQKNEVDMKRSNSKSNQKLISTTHELDETKNKHHRLTRRCGELEARIDRLGECVYDARRLEHCALSLIAFMQNIDTDEKFKLPK